MTLSDAVPLAGLYVSRETVSALRSLEALVVRWTPAINLVAPSTVSVLWDRHIVDSAQLFGLVPAEARHWVDLGSGGGFPGLVIAILAKEARPQLTVTLVESDARKATFLREASRQLDVRATVITTRAEACQPLSADVVSARAFAPLSALLPLAQRHLTPDGIAVFPKGRNWRMEMEDAQKQWSFQADAVKSVSDDQAAILVVRKIDRAPHN